MLALAVMVWMGAIGFLDDYLKLRQRRKGEKNRGLVERYKLAGQVTIGVALGWYLWLIPDLHAAGRVDHAAVLQVRARRAGGGVAGLALRAVRHVRADGCQQRRESHRWVGRARRGADGGRGADLRGLRLRHRAGRHEHLSADLLPARCRRARRCSVRRSSGPRWDSSGSTRHPRAGVHGRHWLAGAGRRSRRDRDPAQVGVPAAAHRRRVRRRDGVGHRAANGVQVPAAAAMDSSMRRPIACFGARRCTTISSCSGGRRPWWWCGSGSWGFCSPRSPSAR